MLLHSRSDSGEKEEIDINSLAEEYLRLAYHGLRAKDNSFNAELITEFDADLPKIKVVPQDIGRVLLNIINNAFQAVHQKSKVKVKDFEPSLKIKTNLKGKHSPSGTGGSAGNNSSIQISISDNGQGIPSEIKDKIFQPFFTTKPTGQGTGLGLSLSYDIVKAHGGELVVESEEGEGTEFKITLPVV
jgi:signal transduction histidine kinase